MFTSVVIAMAPTETAREAYDQGLDLARALGASVHLVGAFDAEDADARRRTEGRLGSTADPLRATGLDVVTHALPGEPAATLVRVADDVGADLIVVGNKGAQGARRVLGSVASGVVAHASCAVTIVKTT